MDLAHNESVVNFFASFDTGNHLTILAFLFIGTLITCIVQSSAAVMAITILLCSTGVLPIYLGISTCLASSGCSACSIPLSIWYADSWATIR